MMTFMFLVTVGICEKGGFPMKTTKKTGIAKTNFWANRSSYASRRSAQNFLNTQLKAKVSANSECLSGCNNSCGSSCATGCSETAEGIRLYYLSDVFRWS